MTTLSHSSLERSKLSTRFLELNLHVELLQCVDCVLVTWSICLVPLAVEKQHGVLCARATTVTVVIESLVRLGMAIMSCGLVCVLVGFHDVELWAKVTAYLVSITVVKAISIPVIAT